MNAIIATFRTAAKAWVAAVGAGCLPIISEATESAFLTVLAVVIAGAATYAVPNGEAA